MAVPTGQGSEYIPDLPYLAIRKLQRSLPKTKAYQLARTFEAVAAECEVPWQLLVSIAFHESSLGIRTVNERSKDYGLMQVNAKNLLRYGLSRIRIEKDAEYSLQFACKLLKENRARYGDKYPYWLGIYRSGTALWKEDIRANAKRYDRIIRKTAAQIGYFETVTLAAK